VGGGPTGSVIQGCVVQWNLAKADTSIRWRLALGTEGS